MATSMPHCTTPLQLSVRSGASLPTPTLQRYDLSVGADGPELWTTTPCPQRLSLDLRSVGGVAHRGASTDPRRRPVCDLCDDPRSTRRTSWTCRRTCDPSACPLPATDRKSVLQGKRLSVRVDLGGRLNITKKTRSVCRRH